MKRPSFSLMLACSFGFTVATLLLFQFLTDEKTSDAQTLPFFQQRQKADSQKTGSGAHAKTGQDSRQNPPIPETLSTLPKPEESPLFVERYAELIPEERVSIQVYEKCNRSVVNVDTRTTVVLPFFFGEDDVPGAGSGVVLNREGHILTNSHVVSKVDSVTVTLFNGESYPARVIGEDPITDLAVLKIDAPAESLHPAVSADSSRLLVGQKVFAIGNPFGLERTLTSGLISSLNRSIPGRSEARVIKGAIQIDAAINPGNSGGALLDTQGRMIGINTAIASKSGGSHGVGFAIPSNTISRIAPQLIKSGRVIRGDTGIAIVREVERDATRGLLVCSLVPNGAAEKAGLRGLKVLRERRLFQGAIVLERPKIDINAADVIVGVDGVETKKAEDFTAIVDDRKPGDRILLDVIRGGQRTRIPLVLE